MGKYWDNKGDSMALDLTVCSLQEK